MRSATEESNSPRLCRCPLSLVLLSSIALVALERPAYSRCEDESVDGQHHLGGGILQTNSKRAQNHIPGLPLLGYEIPAQAALNNLPLHGHALRPKFYARMTLVSRIVNLGFAFASIASFEDFGQRSY